MINYSALSFKHNFYFKKNSRLEHHKGAFFSSKSCYHCKPHGRKMRSVAKECRTFYRYIHISAFYEDTTSTEIRWVLFFHLFLRLELMGKGRKVKSGPIINLAKERGRLF